ncbi:MAG: right-handed parallel beta-helix repeat-containing protein, partial [Elusimicrobia bacterium]|nr:right-handed parallel beta-helix repeat-containing protein [Elusimicrobiota bacterium]
MAASKDSNRQKKLLFGNSAPTFRGGRSKLSIDPTGGFQLVGIPSNYSLMERLNTSSTYYTFVDSGAFTLAYSTVNYADELGLQLSGSGPVFLATSTFDQAGQGGSSTSTYITARSLNSSATFYGLVFNKSSPLSYPYLYNVKVDVSDTNLNWTMRKWGGVRGGESYDSEIGSSNKVQWAPFQPTFVSPPFLAVYLSSVTAQWGSGGNDPGTSYVLEASTGNFPNTFSGNKSSITYNTFASPQSLDPNTTYYFGVSAAWIDASPYTSLGSTSTLANVIVSSQIYNVGVTSVTWNWPALPVSPSSRTSEGYILQASTASDFTGTLYSSSSYVYNSSTLTVSGLSPGTLYYFRVGSLNWNSVPNYVLVGSTMTLSLWDIQTLANAGTYTSIVLDSTGNPHVSYVDGGNLKYTKWTGSTWIFPETAGSVASGGLTHSAMAIDSTGNVHVAYHEVDFSRLMYNKRTATGWGSAQIVDSSGAGYVSLALDGSMNPHISYYADLANLRYIRWNGSGWDAPQIVDSTGTVGQYTSIVIDSTGNPHISYYRADAGNVAIKYAQWTGSGWNISLADYITGGGYTSIALDGNGNPRISYYEDETGNGDGEIKYISWLGSGFGAPETVELNMGAGSYTSLILDGAGTPHISYYNTHLSRNELIYATKSPGWTTEVADTTGNVGQYSSLAMDQFGVPHISYYDATGFDVQYAKRRIPTGPGAMGGGNAKSRPQAPTNFQASSINANTVNWGWTDKATNELGFRLYGSQISSGPYTLLAGTQIITPNQISYTETGVTPGINYRYLVAVTTGGHVFSNLTSVDVCSPKLSAASGDWSVTTTWVGGKIPDACSPVTIQTGHKVRVDVTNAAASTTTVLGTLEFSRTSYNTLTLSGGNLDVQPGGILDMGTEASSIPSTVKATLVLASGTYAGQYGLIVRDGGNFTVRGTWKVPFTVATGNIMPGSVCPDDICYFNISENPFSDLQWNLNDVITVGQTERSATDQTERRIMVDGGPGNIGVDSTFSFYHYATSTIRVANLTRNVVVRSAGTDVNTNTAYIQNLTQHTTGFVLTYGEFAYLNNGIYLGSGSRATISSCTIHDGNIGIYSNSASNNSFTHNLVYRNTSIGINLNTSSGNTLTSNHAYSSGGNGIFVSNASDNNVLNSNYVYSNA